MPDEPMPDGYYPKGLPAQMKPYYHLDITHNSFWTIVHQVNRVLRRNGHHAAADEFLRFAQEMEHDLGMLFMLCLDYINPEAE